MIARFGEFELDQNRFELCRNGEPVLVEPQVFDVLVYLLANRDRLVTKEELLDEVWGTRFVTESTLTTRIKVARRAVGDDGQRQAVIRTVHGRGYRFVADVVDVDERPASETTSSEPIDQEQQIYFCRASDGARLAYGVHGEGPVLMKAANWLTHLDHDWNSPVWRHWLRSLGERHRVIRYDERGSGLSDRDTDDYSLEAWIRDLGAVADDAGLDRFPLLGISQGAAVAIAYTVANPERVSHLVLYGSYASGPLTDSSPERHRAQAHAMIELARVGWGMRNPAFRQLFTSLFMPAGTPAQWAAFDELQRNTTTPANAARFLEAFCRLDVRDLADRVRVPTIVLHCRGDRVWPFEQGRQLAARIQGSRFVPLQSENHLLFEHEPAWAQFLDEMERFLETASQ